MAVQSALADRDSYVNAIGTALSSGTLDIRSGAQPANCAAANSGTLGVSISLGASPFTTASGTGVLSLATSHSGTGAANITAGHFRFMTSGAACRLQGTVGPQTTGTTSATTAANGDVLTFASAPSVVVGQTLAGTGIPAGTTIAAIFGATLIMSKASTAGVGSGVTITFGFDMTIDNASIATSQSVTVASYTYTPGDA